MKINYYQMSFKGTVIVLFLAAVSLSLFVFCSDNNPTGNNDPEYTVSMNGVTVIPDHGAPGTPVLLQGLQQLPENNEWNLYIGGVAVPLIANDSSSYLTSVPLIFSPADSTWPTAPADPVDIVLYRDGVPVDSLVAALTVEELMPAEGTTDSIIGNLTEGVSALKQIITLDNPADSQMLVILLALDEILVNGENSLTEILNGTAPLITTDSVPDSLISALCHEAGLDEVIKNWSDKMQALSLALSQKRALSPDGIYDGQDLAFHMQLQWLLKEFGQTVVHETNSTWSELTTILGLIGVVRQPLPPIAQAVVQIASFVLNILDFVINKVLIGILPGELTKLELDFQDHIVTNGEMTWSIVYISAKNDSVAIGLQDVISQVLNAVSFAHWARNNSIPRELMTDQQLVNDIIQDLTLWILGVIRSIQSEMNLPDLTERIPEMTWDSLRIYEPGLLNLMSSNIYLLDPIDSLNNWKASDTSFGWGKLSVQTASGSSAWRHPTLVSLGYNGGTFGDDVISSNIDSVRVAPELYLEVSFPSNVDSGGSATLIARAGYVLFGSVLYTSGINIGVNVSGGTVQPGGGVTDASGNFIATVFHDNTSDEIEVSVTASGAEGSFAFEQVTADVIKDILQGCANKMVRFIDPSYCDNCWIAMEYHITENPDTVFARIHYVYEFTDWPNYFSAYSCWEYVPWDGDGFIFQMNHDEGVWTICKYKCVEVRFIDVGDPDTCGCTGSVWNRNYPDESCY